MGDDAATKYQIDELLECDKGNVEQTRRALLDFHKDSLGATDECLTLFDRIGILFGEAAGYDKHHAMVNEWLKNRRGTAEQNISFLEGATLIGKVEGTDPVAEAKDALEKAYSVIARTYLLLRLGRDFFFGLTDLLRLRVTSMHGYVRIQAETTAILALCGTNPPIATDWLNVDTPEEGKAFYKKYHNKITAKLRDLGLYEHFDNGSHMSLHSRVLGVAGGIVAGKKNARRGEIRLLYQEEDDAIVIFLWFCVYLRAHKDIFDALPKAMPEVDFSQVDFQRYDEMVESLWVTLRSLYIHERLKGLRVNIENKIRS